MKKILLSMFVAGMALSFSAKAQLSVSLNFGARPNLWLPRGYETNDFYFIPEVNSYYDVPDHVFVYNQNGRWVRSSMLPGRYRDYDLRRSRVVAVRQQPPFWNDNGYRRDDNDYRSHDNGKHLGWYKNGRAEERGDRDDRREEHGNGKGHGHDRD